MISRLRQVQGYQFLRAINTYAVLLFDQSNGLYYVHGRVCVRSRSAAAGA